MVMPMGSGIRLLAILASGIVLLGFAFFAVDEMNRGSQNQQNALESELRAEAENPAVIAPNPREERLRERRNGDFRELIDDANDVLLAECARLLRRNFPWKGWLCEKSSAESRRPPPGSANGGTRVVA